MYQRRKLWSIVTSFILLVICNKFAEAQYARTRDKPKGISKAPFVLRGDQTPPPDTESDPEEVHPFTDLSTWYYKPRAFTQLKLHPCEQGSCYPATGNLLIGREDQLYASSTCGLYEQKRYCIVSHLEEKKKCFWCDSRPGSNQAIKNHNISNIVSKTYPGTQETTWWQSENGKENVYVQLNLEAEFHFTHLIMKFRTFRPAAMLIERSYDNNKTWQVYRYFADNCDDSFPGIKKGTPENLTDVVCESRYSGVSPSSNGEVIYRVLMQNVKIDNPYSQQVQNLLKITNLRINFTKLHTLGDDLLDKREEIQEKYYYAINYMVVRGSCSCYGHANRCLPLAGINPKPDMVHGRCECTHNTKGRNCEKCEDFFNDLPWRPAVGKQSNACKRCNCNNHAWSCHFDSAVYEASGRVSGGVCDGCQHDTMGIHCEQCKPFYYRDPTRDIQDPDVCKECDCDPQGSLDLGICDSITDTVNNLVAGSCHCKTNVEGRRCDQCKNGFWNFTSENPDGCQPCTCSTLGTVDNQGCDVDTGECTCKRYVTGRDCRQCLPEFWGLSEKQDGCEPCDCDPGGSLDNNCDLFTGQCKCRGDMSGRTCNIPKQLHFTASLDFLLYEAELAKGSSDCQVVIREPYRDGQPNTWTGSGFMRAYEGSFIEFPINNIRTTSLYDAVLRYEPTSNQPWYDVEMSLIRPDPVDVDSLCNEASLDDEPKHISLPSHSRSVVAPEPLCLEAGKSYKLVLEFKRSQYEHESPNTASILIDSIVLTPRIESIPWFKGSAPAEQRRREFERFSCNDILKNPPVDTKHIPEVCKNDFNSIGAFIINGALACQCDPTGAVSKLCDEHGGRCTCKPNVVGRRCDRCAPGTYGFGPEGCKACDCNSIGALDNFCNVTTGLCKCRANTYGRECDQCRIGFWNFPNCQRCDCNGHAETCHARTGACSNCRDATEGHTCDHCVDGYYGDPRLNVDIPCRQCPCPGTLGSNHSFADTCQLNPLTQDVICACKEGFTGARCDVCADNYFGNPEVPGGNCQLCDCNDNIDIMRPGNCDPHSGQCKQCLYETTGDHCEMCRSGFYRTSPEEMCRECVCHILGWNKTAGDCDRYTGKCPCYPNVIGDDCEKCKENHWKIASGKGCEPCDCDPVGSKHLQCNVYLGECDCRENFGGRQCNECKANYWGDPKADKCIKCECNLEGSETEQCDQKTGNCKCRPGIGGDRCDQCARGYVGVAPHCRPCGECFDNWDKTLTKFENETQLEIARAKDIKNVGAGGAYTTEFNYIQNKLNDIEDLLNQTATIDLDSVEGKLDHLRDLINKTEHGELKNLNEILANADSGNQVAKVTLQNFKNKMDLLRNKTDELRVNGTKLQERNVQGALDIIKNAKTKADDATKNATNTQDIIKNVERRCKSTENKLKSMKSMYSDKHEEDMASLKNLTDLIKNLNDSLPKLNKLICDGSEYPCDNICGGALCGHCGAITCNGAKNQAEDANSLAMKTEALYNDKEKLVNEYIRNITTVNGTLVKNQAISAFNKSLEAKINASNMTEKVNDKLAKIDEFMQQNNSITKELQNKINNILTKDIKWQPEEIKEFATNIKVTADSLTNIEPILAETEGNLSVAKKLKEDAENAKKQVDDIKNTVNSVEEFLKKTENVQKETEIKIGNISQSFKDIKRDLDNIDKMTNGTYQQIENTSGNLGTLDKELEDLKKLLRGNQFTAQTLKNESTNIKTKTEETMDKLKVLLNDYDQAKEKLNASITKADNSKTRAENLVNRTVNLSSKVKTTQESISKLKSPSSNNLGELEEQLKQLISDMDKYTEDIEKKAEYFKHCNSI
nr:laminin subunit beta-1 isoform X1 [Onthophagus taurus]XP_022901154.1 laminin subunit beta-1 isoform X1 [Onthophagus taurus]